MTKNTKKPVILTIIRIAGFFSKSFSEKFLFILDNCSISREFSSKDIVLSAALSSAKQNAATRIAIRVRRIIIDFFRMFFAFLFL